MESITDKLPWHKIQDTYFERRFIRKLILFNVLGFDFFDLQERITYLEKKRITYLVLHQYNEINLCT